MLHRRYLVERFFGANVSAIWLLLYCSYAMSWLPLFKLRLGRAIFAILHCRYLFLLYRSTPFPPRSPVRQCPSESNEGAVIVGGSDMGTDFGEFRLGHPIRILLRVFLLGRLSVSASFGQETTTVSRVRSPETGGQPRGLGPNRNRRSIKIVKGGSFRHQRLIEGGEAGRGRGGEGECLVRAGSAFRRCCTL